MKIIKDGKRNTGAFKCKCKKCGCKFVADVSDYTYVKCTFADGYKPTKNNVPSNEIMVNCPNCNNKVIKNLFDDADGWSIVSLLELFNTILCLSTVIYLMCTFTNAPTGSSIFFIILNLISVGINAYFTIIERLGLD